MMGQKKRLFSYIALVFMTIGAIRLLVGATSNFDDTEEYLTYVRPAKALGFARSASGEWVCMGNGSGIIADAVRDASTQYNVSYELLYAMIHAESGCNMYARSPKGAMGLMQLMPGTARMVGVSNPFSIRENVFGGARYLAMMLDEFGGNVDLALAAYNAGPATVHSYSGIPPYRETKRYVRNVRGLYARLREKA